MLVANLYSLRGGFVSVCGGLFFGMRWVLGGGVGEWKYISEKDIQSALWGQPAAMLPSPVYRWYSSTPGLWGMSSVGSGTGDGVSLSVLVDAGALLLTLVDVAACDGIKVVGGKAGKSAPLAESGGNGNGEPFSVGSGS